MTVVEAGKIQRLGRAGDRDELREAFWEICADIAAGYAPYARCQCDVIPGNVTVTGHKGGCEIDSCVRMDLARAGIV